MRLSQRRLVRLAAVLVAVVSVGCGGKGAIYLTIDARGPAGVVQVPGDVDQVAVLVTAVPEGTVLLEKGYPLEPATHRFPLTLALTQGEKTGKRVKIEVRLKLGEQEKGYGTTTVAIVPEEVNEVTVRIDT